MGTTDESPEELAEDRTDLAEDRTVMAVERTFAGWMRTAFAAIGIGLGFKALFGAMEPVWLPKAIATLFIALGGVFAISAEHRARKAFDRLAASRVYPISPPNLKWIAYSVSGGAVMLILALWLFLNGEAF